MLNYAIAPQEDIDFWSHDYTGSDMPISFEGYKALVARMGETRMSPDGSSRIYLHKKLYGHPTAIRIVLWHEFCHGWAWHDVRHGGHDRPFLERDLRKPLNWLMGIWPAIIIMI